MTKGELRFNEIKDEYLKQFERTTGQKLDTLYYEDGFIHMGKNPVTNKRQISEFEEMLAALKERPDFIRAENKKWVAKLVTVTLTTRVIVEEGASDENIFEAAREGLKTKAKEEMFDNLDKIENDSECPYGTFDEDKQAN